MSIGLRGSHYRNVFVYNLLTFLKLRSINSLRFKLISTYVMPGDSLIDICSGPARLLSFIPSGCSYTAVDKSSGFLKHLKRRDINFIEQDLHQGLKAAGKYDLAVMSISLCHFRNTSVNSLLDTMKKIAARVLILEEVTKKERGRFNVFRMLMDYFCDSEYYEPANLFTEDEFKKLMEDNAFIIDKQAGNYILASFESDTPSLPENNG